jgi:exodeoxyribonuclease VII small subunit
MVEKIKFEDAMNQLDGVVRQLESGEGTLDEMIAQYEKGMKLVKLCTQQLDAYEAKITKLSGEKEES